MTGEINMKSCQAFIDEINAKVGSPVVITGGKPDASDRFGLMFFVNLAPNKWVEIGTFYPTGHLQGLVSELCLAHFGKIPGWNNTRTTFWVFPDEEFGDG